MERVATCAVLAIVSASSAAHRAVGQAGVELSAHPGVAYPFRLESPSVGGWLGFWVSRTEAVAVGGEIGAFSGATRNWEIETNDPVFGRVTLNERHEEGLLFVRGLVRYRVGRLAAPESYGILGTGLYTLRERREIIERDPWGQLVRAGALTYVSYSLHPGASAGWALGWALPESWMVLGDLCLHFIIGADSVFYPMLVGSIGLAKRL